MKILVCTKQILDPEIPLRDFRVDREHREAVKGSASLVTNIFCENALETALHFRDRAGGEITALSFGPPSAEDSLRKALALRVDHACLVLNKGSPHPNSMTTARILGGAVKKLGGFDLILLGREAGDWGAGQTGGLLAEELGLPFLSLVDQIAEADQGIRLRRQTELGREQVTARLPLVVTITNSEENVPRIPKTRDIMLSSRKPITTWQVSDLGLGADDLAATAEGTEVVDLFIPEKNTSCEFVTGETLEERISTFAEHILKTLHSA